MKTKIKKIDSGEYEINKDGKIFYAKKGTDSDWHLFLVDADFKDFGYVFSQAYSYLNTFASLKYIKEM